MAPVTRNRTAQSSASVVEEREDGSIAVEADTPEEAMALARHLLGDGLQIREAARHERGGLRGFFAREVYRVDAEPAAAPIPASRPEVVDLVRRIEAAAGDVDASAGRTAPPVGGGIGHALDQVDDAEEEFGDLLRRELGSRGIRSWSEERATSRAGSTPPPEADSAPSGRLDPPASAGPRPSGRFDAPAGPAIDLRMPTPSRPGAPVPVGPAAARRPMPPTGPTAPALPPSRPSESPASPSPRVEEAPVSASPRVEEAPVSASPRVEEAPVSASPRVEEALVSASPRVEEALVSASPRVEEALVSASPRVEEALVSASPRVEEAPVSASPRVEGAPTAAPPPGAVMWSVDRLAHLGLPFAVVESTVGLDPADDLAWLQRLSEGLADYLHRPTDRSIVFAGPRADRVASGLGLPCVEPPDRPPPGGSIALKTIDDGAGRAWLERARGDRELHLVIGGGHWELLLTKDPVAVVAEGPDRIVTALQIAAEHQVGISHVRDGRRVRRANTLDLAIAVRSLVRRR